MLQELLPILTNIIASGKRCQSNIRSVKEGSLKGQCQPIAKQRKKQMKDPANRGPAYKVKEEPSRIYWKNQRKKAM